MFHDNETRCFIPMKHLESGTVTTEISISYIDFCSWCLTALFHAVSCCFVAVSLLFHAVSLTFHAVSLMFHCCFIAVSLLLHAVSLLFHAVSLLFHGVSSLCFMVFQGVSLPCFILFHDHETDAVGTSLTAALNPSLSTTK